MAVPKAPTPIDRFLDEEKSLACIHCGLCLSSCPTYLETGNENDSPRGRIYQMRALQSGTLALNDRTVRHIDLCLGCRACEAACPSGVQYGGLLEATREYVEKHHRRGCFETFLRRVMIEGVFPYSNRVKIALLPAQLLKMIGLDRFLPDALRRFTDLIPSRQQEMLPLPEFAPAIGERVGAVGFLSGCVMNVMFNRTNRNSIHLLNLAGYDVYTPATQGCCGALHAHCGQLETARSFATALMAEFQDLPIDLFVINAAGCGSTVKDYGHLLNGEAAQSEAAHDFARKTCDLSEVLAKNDCFMKLLRSAPRHPISGGRVTYHEACHLAHAQRVTSAPRSLVFAVAGDNFLELPEADVCCGSAGSYNLTEPSMSNSLRSRKLDCIERAGAKILVSTNPGCLLQIESGLRGNPKRDTETVQLADYLYNFLKSSG